MINWNSQALMSILLQEVLIMIFTFLEVLSLLVLGSPMSTGLEMHFSTISELTSVTPQSTTKILV